MKRAVVVPCGMGLGLHSGGRELAEETACSAALVAAGCGVVGAVVVGLAARSWVLTVLMAAAVLAGAFRMGRSIGGETAAAPCLIGAVGAAPFAAMGVLMLLGSRGAGVGGVGVLVVAGLVGVAASEGMKRGRAAGALRPRVVCPECGYDLEGLEALGWRAGGEWCGCPECGFPAARESTTL